MSSAATNRLNSLRPAGSLVVLLAAMYAVCADPGSVSRHISSKYRAAFKAAEARVAQFAEPEHTPGATLWELLQELIHADQPEAPRPQSVWKVAVAPALRVLAPAFLPALFQRPPPVHS